ncbi:uncharacterized protein LOC136026401 [Artemia franciscana]|uniref:Chitin-binding type-2 domain-containing protein n=1 Tax=Artemia franciscana TaxID=6661 RepID=A0AA88HER5_ARTSF|nr:hypothetical protein QYM36_012015 [Artemia franciscana]
MPVWMILVAISGVLVSANFIGSSEFVRKRSGYDEKDAFYLNNRFSPGAEIIYPVPRTYTNYFENGWQPADNGQAPSAAKEYFSLPERSKKLDHYNNDDDDISEQLAEILPLVKFSCQGKEEGYYADLDFDCAVFHFCSTDQVRYTFICGGNGKFNQRYLVCDYEQSTNCTHSYFENVEAERKRNRIINSRLDSFDDYDEMPELVRTKRIGNDFAKPDGYYDWDNKYDPYRFKRSVRKRRSTSESSEDLLAMSSEPFGDFAEFADRVGSYYTDSQWRSTGINLPNNRRRNFSPYQKPWFANQQSRQSLREFRSEPRNTAQLQSEHRHNFHNYALNPEPGLKQSLNSEPSKGRKSYIDETELYENFYQNSKRNKDPSASLTRLNNPRNSFGPSQNLRSDLGTSYSHSKESNGYELREPISHVTKPISYQDYETTEPYSQPNSPKLRRKIKKRPHPQKNFSNDESQRYKTIESLNPTDAQRQHFSYGNVDDPAESFEISPWATQSERPMKRPLDSHASIPSKSELGPQVLASQPFLVPTLPESKNGGHSFGMGKVMSGIKKLVSSTFAPISTTQATAKQNYPNMQSQSTVNYPLRKWSQESEPKYESRNVNQFPQSLTFDHNERSFKTQEKTVVEEQDKQLLELDEPYSKYQPHISANLPTKWQRSGPESKELYRDDLLSTRRFNRPKGLDRFHDKGEISTPETSKNYEDTFDVDNEEAYVSQEDDNKGIPKFEASLHEARRIDNKRPQVNLETSIKMRKQFPVNQDLPHLSWKSVFNDAESYESDEDDIEEDSTENFQPIQTFEDSTENFQPIQTFDVASTLTPDITKEEMEPTEAPEIAVSTSVTEEQTEPTEGQLLSERRTVSSRIERLSNYKKRIEQQKEQARLRYKTTTLLPIVINNDDDGIRTEKPQKQAASERPSRVKFPQRNRLRSRTSTPHPKEILPEEEKDERSESFTEPFTTTTSYTTPSPRKTFDLNRYRSSNKYSYPKLRHKEEFASKIDTKEKEQVQSATSDVKEVTDEVLENSEERGLKLSRKSFRGGYRRKYSTTSRTVLDEVEETPQIEEIMEVEENSSKEKRPILWPNRKFKRRPLVEQEESDHSTDNLRPGKEEIEEPKIDFSEQKDGTSSHLERNINNAIYHIKKQLPTDVQENLPQNSSSEYHEKLESTYESSLEKNTKHEKDENTSNYESENSSQSEETGKTKLEVQNLEEKNGGSYSNEKLSHKINPYEEEELADDSEENFDMAVEATSVHTVSNTLEENESKSSEALPDMPQAEVASPQLDSIRYEKTVQAVTASPWYITMATNYPILPIEELLPLYPKDNGRGM